MYRQRAPRSPAQRFAFAVVAVLAIALSYWAGNLARGPEDDVPRKPHNLVAPTQPVRLTELGFVDQYDRPFDAARTAGRWNVLVLATPADADATRAALTRLVHVHNWLADRHEVQRQFQGLFVSLQPGTGQAAALKDLVGFYSPDFLGLAGEVEALLPLVPPSAATGSGNLGSADDALRAGQQAMAVVGPDGMLRGWFTAEVPPATIARDVKALVLHDAAQ
jgi:cytochrome oxidase Cu insertion factor (SCO1/SenC/PrrC family)